MKFTFIGFLFLILEVEYHLVGWYNQKQKGERDMSKVDTTEKITINVNTIDLGYIDLLVSEGYYATRTEFIKTAIKKQLDNHNEDTKRLLGQKVNLGYTFSIGVGGFTKKELENLLNKKEKKINAVFVGLFILSKDVSLELLEETIDSIKVYGVSRCSKEIKERYKI